MEVLIACCRRNRRDREEKLKAEGEVFSEQKIYVLGSEG